MKIAVICANGKAGKLIVEEAARRGHEVTAVVRGENRSAAKSAIIKDLFDLTADDLKGFDAVVDAFGAWTPETLPQHVTSLRKICGVLSGSAARLYVVGGAGSLYLDAEHKTRLMDAPEFPAVFMGVAQATAVRFLRAARTPRRNVDVPLPRRRFPRRGRAHGPLQARGRGVHGEREGRELHKLRRLRRRDARRDRERQIRGRAHICVRGVRFPPAANLRRLPNARGAARGFGGRRFL